MRSQSKGFGLIELLVVLSLIAILAVFAVPNFRSAIQRSQADTEVSDFQRLLNFARLEAMDRGVSVRVMPVSGTAWTGQLQAIQVSNAADSTKALRKATPIGSGATLTVPNATAIDFNNLGALLAPASSLAITYTLGSITRTVNVCLSGRIIVGGSC